MSDAFGRASGWLAELELPGDERETVDGPAPDRLPRRRDRDRSNAASPSTRSARGRSAADDRARREPDDRDEFIAAVGDVRRFPDRASSSATSASTPGPPVGDRRGRHGRVSSRAPRSPSMLAEAAIVAVSTPGPMRAFYERVRARRGAQIAIVAVARKLAVLFWHLLTREQDYAFQRPSLTARSSARLELRAGAQRHPGRRDLANQERLQPARRTRPRARTLRTSRSRLPPIR